MHFTEIANCIVNSVSTLLFLPLWIILIILLNALFPFVNSKRLTFNLSLSVCLINLIFSIICLIFCIKNPSSSIENNILWLNSDIKVFLGTLIDNLSSIFLFFYSIIAIFFQFFIYKNLKDTIPFQKFFIYLNLINFSIIGLIVSSNLIQSMFFVIFTSISCYLLLSCSSMNETTEFATRKIFLLNNLGDISLLIGVLIIAYSTSIFNVSQNLILLSYSDFIFHVDNFYSMFSEPLYIIISTIMLIPILIKLGQAPFFSLILKLNEHQKISAPISLFCFSLCGFYLLTRIYPMIIISDVVKNILVIIGILSAFLGIYFALSQNFLNKFLYTLGISQFGIILLTIGLNGYSIAIFSFLSFVFAYLLLFFIVYLIDKNCYIDIKNAGGLRKDYPLVATLFGIASFSICGLFFGGFYSQHFIFSLIYETQYFGLISSYLIVIFLTTFALARVYFLMFEGDKTNTIKFDTSFKLMISPILCATIIVLSNIFKTDFNNFIYFIKPENLLPLLTVPFFIQLFIIVSAIYLAFTLYVVQNSMFMKIKENILSKNNLIYKLSYEYLYLDKICKYFQNIFLKTCNIFKSFENILDGISFIIVLFRNILDKLFKLKINIQSWILFVFIAITILMILILIIYIFMNIMEV